MSYRLHVLGVPMFILVQAALATSCMPSAPVLELPTTFGETLTIRVSGTDASQMVHHFRLRDAEGRLVPWRAEVLGPSFRYLPETTLPAGNYTLEQFVRYDKQGRRLDFGQSDRVHHGAWFPVQEVQHRVGGAAPGVPTVEWRRWMDMRPMLSATIVADPSTARVDLEVRGLGVYDSRTWNGPGAVELFYGNDCDPTTLRPLPLGDLEVRVVAESASGKRTPGPWATLGISTPSDSPPYALVHAPPSGHLADLSHVTSWTPIVLEPPSGDVLPATTACTLVPDAPPKARFAVPHGTKAFGFTDEGDLRATWLDDGDVMVNGKRHALLSTPRPSIVEFRSGVADLVVIRGKDASCVGQEYWWTLGKLAGDVVRPVFTAPKTFWLDAERTSTGVRVSWRTGEQRRFEQDLGVHHQPIGEAREVLIPIALRQPLTVNGREVLPYGSLVRSTVHGDRVYATHTVGFGFRVMALDERAAILWEHPVSDAALERFQVDDDGVHLTTVRGQSLRFTHDGKAVPPIHMELFDRPEPPVERPPLMMGSRRVVGGTTIHTVDQGVCSNDYVVPADSMTSHEATHWANDDEVRVGWIEDGHAVQQTLRCGPTETIVPPCWTVP